MGKASRRMRRAAPEQPRFGSRSRSRSRTLPRRWLFVGVPLALLVVVAAVVLGVHHTNATSRSPLSMPVTGARHPRKTSLVDQGLQPTSNFVTPVTMLAWFPTA
jgi:hypothetical protein